MKCNTLIQCNSRQVKYSKYLPHNFLAEKMVLSCLINRIREAIEYDFKKS